MLEILVYKANIEDKLNLLRKLVIKIVEENNFVLIEETSLNMPPITQLACDGSITKTTFCITSSLRTCLSQEAQANLVEYDQVFCQNHCSKCFTTCVICDEIKWLYSSLIP